MKNLLVIENWADRGGDIMTLLRKAGHATVLTRPYAGDSLPPPEAFDAVVLSGGPMSVLEGRLARYAFLKEVLRYTDRLIASSTPCLGICLGHQILAVALGGHVEAMGYLDAGVRLIRPVEKWCSPGPDFPSFVFHRDHVVEPPPGCVKTFTSEGCAVEGFQHQVLPIQAVQFHPEAPQSRVVEVLENWRSEGNRRAPVGEPHGFDAREAHAVFDNLVSGLIAHGASG